MALLSCCEQRYICANETRSVATELITGGHARNVSAASCVGARESKTDLALGRHALHYRHLMPDRHLMPAGGDGLMKPEMGIDLIAEATCYGDSFRDWTQDSVAVGRFMDSQNVKIDDRYREMLLPARTKHEACRRKACTKRRPATKALKLSDPVARKFGRPLKLK
jgi:hypothetical protein